MPTVMSAEGTPLTFTVGGKSFTVRDFENELTMAENRLLIKAFSPVVKYFAVQSGDESAAADAIMSGVSIMAELDLPLILAICTRPTNGKFDKNKVQEWREFFDNNQMPEATQEIYKLFLVIAPASIAKYSPIFSA